MGVFLLFITLATVFHYTHMRHRKQAARVNDNERERETKMSTTQELIISFSLINNVKKMFHVQTNEMNLDCVSGIKVLSMMFILASHALLFLVSGPVLNTEFYEQVI